MLLPAQLKAKLLLRACHDRFQGVIAWCCVQEWIHPLVLLRRMSMSIAKERPQDAHRQSQPDTQISAAPSGNACSPEVPDLEMGLLPRPETDSASALNSNAVKLEKTSPERCGMLRLPTHFFLPLYVVFIIWYLRSTRSPPTGAPRALWYPYGRR